MFPKWGSADEQARVEEAVEKLAAVGVVENLLDTLPATLSEAAQKTAAEVRSLNRQYGTYVLSELCR
jgi:ABC-type histidine transport system ATPase subunit